MSLSILQVGQSMGGLVFQPFPSLSSPGRAYLIDITEKEKKGGGMRDRFPPTICLTPYMCDFPIGGGVDTSPAQSHHRSLSVTDSWPPFEFPAPNPHRQSRPFSIHAEYGVTRPPSFQLHLPCWKIHPGPPYMGTIITTIRRTTTILAVVATVSLLSFEIQPFFPGTRHGGHSGEKVCGSWRSSFFFAFYFYFFFLIFVSCRSLMPVDSL
ncbi:hypothetical protein P170DRAFT_54567 [Aspergillus steynii IBT 23096]|uniref:Uncharacterized protein n=1 Tax=Aspergillus steynii IBT 23096 TaxID=1392250 RepID=A0A2I2FSD5_9EURO|nr:uncharacterized protein P170DRAFT_54567 [Aspergillus steynii IBT 23096]PLB43517.1 hypothetical protein P170DRAFT_54567 [Aspergillus steynii IBT 23096]